MAEGFDDSDPTCDETYVSVTALSNDQEPGDVSEALGVDPTDDWRPGDPRHGVAARGSGWQLSSQLRVDSRDARRHLVWILDQLPDDSSVLKELRKKGWTLSVSCYWRSARGHGGPRLDPAQCERLGHLGLPIWFDVYFIAAGSM